MKSAKKCLVFVMIVTLITGCAVESAEELLSPPKLNKEQSGVYKALGEKYNGGFELKYPQKGDYRSAIIFRDLDGDQIPEAVVFLIPETVYTDKERIYVCLLRKTETETNKSAKSVLKWTVVKDRPLDCAEIEKVVFTNIEKSGGYGGSEIAVGGINETYGQSERKIAEKTCAVFSYRNNQFNAINSFPALYFDSDDYFDLGTNQLLYIAIVQEKPLLYSLVMKNGLLSLNAECPLANGAEEYFSIKKAQVSRNIFGAVIEHTKNSNTYGTDMVYYGDSGVLQNAALLDPDNSALLTQKTAGLTSYAAPADVDGNGIIDFGGSGENFSDIPQITLLKTDWYGYDAVSETFTRLYESYVCGEYGFTFLFPAVWAKDITAEINDETSYYGMPQPIQNSAEEPQKSYDGVLFSVKFIRGGNNPQTKKTLLEICAVASDYALSGYVFCGRNRAHNVDFYRKVY